MPANAETSTDTISLPKKVLFFFATIYFYIVVLGLAIPTALTVMAVIFPLFWYPPAKRWTHAVACNWGRLSMLLMRVVGLGRVRYQGFEKLKGFQGVILANHQSQIDILAMLGSFANFRWVSKASMFKIPLIGWAMYLTGYIGLVRGEAASIKKMVQDCKYCVEQGNSVLLFPEGTRTTTGKLLPFKVGGFSIAKKVNAPIALITIEGSWASLPPKQFLMRKRLDVTITVREVLRPEDFADWNSKELMRQVEAKFHQWLEPGSSEA
ncbi:MAG: 1-acyl-sn-glycerol-3-phosphate acyltransferase [Planctomycetes bacterium]|nr:1-acyl-sn-glycerol-3-phosphate acyltransferase [Planctomycetota bacterium]